MREAAVLDRNIERVLSNLRKHHFNAEYFADIEHVKSAIAELLGMNRSFAFGGSMTLEQTGLKQFIIDTGTEYIERLQGSEEEKIESERRALHTDIYFAGINAISADGQIVNIDKRGNRVGAITFGPRNVVLVSSVNKICPDLESAVSRAKNTAAVKNCHRFNLNTPCIKTGHCIDCESEHNICYTTVITKRSYPHGRISVFLIDGDYGF